MPQKPKTAKPYHIEITPRGYRYTASVTTACPQKELSYHFQLSNTTGRHEITKNMQFHDDNTLFLSNKTAGSIIIIRIESHMNEIIVWGNIPIFFASANDFYCV